MPAVSNAGYRRARRRLRLLRRPRRTQSLHPHRPRRPEPVGPTPRRHRAPLPPGRHTPAARRREPGLGDPDRPHPRCPRSPTGQPPGNLRRRRSLSAHRAATTLRPPAARLPDHDHPSRSRHPVDATPTIGSLIPMPFERIIVIFNPQSTRPGTTTGRGAGTAWRDRLPDVPVRPVPHRARRHARTGRAGRRHRTSADRVGQRRRRLQRSRRRGHAGRQPERRLRRDGRRQRQRPPPNTGEQPLVDAIVAGEVRHIDLLRLTVGSDSDAHTRYAHSYIGMGLTPIVAIDLEKGGKGSLKEIVSVVRTFAKFRPFTIDVDPGGRRSLDSLLFANIDEMAKYATLSEDSRPDDGRFEIIALPHTAKWRILAVALESGHPRTRPATHRAPLPLHHPETHPHAARRRSHRGRGRHLGERRHRRRRALHPRLITPALVTGVIAGRTRAGAVTRTAAARPAAEIARVGGWPPRRWRDERDARGVGLGHALHRPAARSVHR